MTLEDIKNKIKTDEYNFLRNNEHLGNNIVLLGLGGSHAYGTAVETSDIDIRGIALNSGNEILLGKDFEQVADKATDTVVYSSNKMLNLLVDSNPNTIEILGLKPEHYILKTSIGDEILNNKNLFISKLCIEKFTGYMNMQLYRLNQLCKRNIDLDDLEKHILETLENMMKTFRDSYSSFEEDSIKLYIDKAVNKNMNTEIFMDVNLHHYPLRDYLDMWNALKTTASQYNKIGKRDSYAVEHKKIAKHSMHLLRSQFMLIDILEKGEIITYREKEHDLLMSIRNGEYLDENDIPREEFFDLVNETKKRVDYAIANTSIPEKVDIRAVKEFKLNLNKRIVENRI